MHTIVVRLVACFAFGCAAFSAIDVSALALTGVKSRKIHGAAGSFDLTIDSAQAFSASVTVEPRTIGTGYVIVFQFDDTIIATGTPASADGFGPVGSVSAAITGAATNEVSVTLTGIPDNKRVRISLTQVNGMLDVSASLGFLVGDVNNTRTANASDISGVKARSGQTAGAASFIFDLNATGAINSSDISAVKARSGLTLASAGDVSLVISKAGTGAGVVTSAPAGLNCGATCAANFTQNTSVTLTASPTIASTFAGWSGGCTGVSPAVTVMLATSLTCTATFAAIPMMAGLSWNAVTSANVSGYRVYYGTSPGTYVQLAGQGLNAGNMTTYGVTGLISGTRYYFAVKAYDASGVESVFSNEAFKDIP